MTLFDCKTFDISTISNATLVELGDLLTQTMCERSDEQKELDTKYDGVYEALCCSLSPAQDELFSKYQREVEEGEQLTGQRQFICGFKLAVRLMVESLK